MGLSTLLIGRRLARKGEDFSRSAYLDTLGRSFVSSLGLSAIFLLTLAVGVSNQEPSPVWLGASVITMILACLVKLLGLIGHYRRLRVLNFGTVFIVFYLLDILVTRLLYLGTNLYLAFKKSDTEKTEEPAEQTTIYGRVWQVVSVLYALLPVVAMLVTSLYLVFNEQTAPISPEITITQEK